jgi:hypothetical protein
VNKFVEEEQKKENILFDSVFFFTKINSKNHKKSEKEK